MERALPDLTLLMDCEVKEEDGANAFAVAAKAAMSAATFMIVLFCLVLINLAC